MIPPNVYMITGLSLMFLTTGVISSHIVNYFFKALNYLINMDLIDLLAELVLHLRLKIV